MYGYDASYVLEAQAKHPDRFGLVMKTQFEGRAEGL
jgi:hypothetical protein